MTDSETKRWLRASTAAIAMLIGAATLVVQPAFAQEGAGTQTQQGPGGGGGGQGPGGGGGEHEDSGEHEDGEDHEEGKGGKAGDIPIGGQGTGAGRGGGGQGSDGGQPAWAQEGIPEIELGRLNVIRSPDRVLDRALAEVIATFEPAMEQYYEMTAAEFADQAESNWDSIAIVDSPLQNLALLRELWTTKDTSLPGVEPVNIAELSAIFLGLASDKTVAITDDTVRALAIIMGVSMFDSTISNIADRAEEVRLGVLAGHG